MAGLEPLLPFIYHEKQQHGSQLCAQHALNAVLQGDYFQAPDLAQFADHLDQLEGTVNEDIGPSSHNMDDTGFFSVDVLEGALRVWGFTLVRWRNPALRDEQDRPQAQMAFILNHQQHWFALRRFGNLSDLDNGHWFNLNSFLPAPEWVSKLYLGMVLSQAEDEGYSVFAVRPLDEKPGAILPHTEADEIAMAIPQPTSANIAPGPSGSRTEKNPQNIPGFEDEDWELQAALQASLAGQNFDYSSTSPSSATINLPAERSTISTVPRAFPDAPNEEDDIATTMARNQARNKAIIERMQREQEMALRETYEENRDSNGEPNTGRRRTAGEEEEEEAVRRAIENSKAESAEPFTPDNALELTSGTWNDRVYDDEDSELQAALRASLEELPEGFIIPPPSPKPLASTSRLSTTTVEAATSDDHTTAEPQAAEVDAEELRRRRLARFGSGK